MIRKETRRDKMNIQEVLEASKGIMGPFCKSCPVCNGLACRNQMPGPGAKGSGLGAIRNYEQWQKIFLCMDTITQKKQLDTKIQLFGRTFELPVFAGPVGAVKLHYGDRYQDWEYNQILVNGCAREKIAAFTGDGTDPHVMEAATRAILEMDGVGIPTVKPWDFDTVKEKMKLVEQSGAFAVAMDIDAAGLPFLKNNIPPAGSKSVEELAQIIQLTQKPFILKGIMTEQGAQKALEAGAKAIVVSNHGGRVLDSCPATASVLSEIVDVVGDQMKILVDGGIRNGLDIFKALAMGADAVMIARPFVNAVYGGQEEGVTALLSKYKEELTDTMLMCGATSIKDINRTMIRFGGVKE